MKRLTVGLLFILVAFAGSGCISYSTLHTATPLETGETEIGSSIGFYGAAASVPAFNTGGSSSDTDTSTSPTSGSLSLPYNEYDVRFGAAPNFDIGLKTNFYGLGMDFNYALVNDSSFAFSIDPGIFMTGWGVIWGTGYVNFLADVLKTERVTFSVGAKPGYWFSVTNTVGNPGFYVGGTATLRLDINDKLALTPGFDLIYPLENNNFNTAFFTAQIGGKFKL